MPTGLIICLDKPHPYLPDQLSKAGYEVRAAYTEPFESLREDLQRATGLILRSRFTLDRAFLDACPNLRFIARMGIGLEHVDVAYAESRGIAVLNSPEGSRDTVAEQTMGMMLGLLNHINKAHQEIQQGIWDRKSNQSFELRHRTVGIIGYGNIGSAVAQRLSGFGCRVIAYDKFKRGFGNHKVEEVSLAQLQREADIVTVHIPYDADNHYFIDEKLLTGFAKPFYLLNTARGLILDTAALVRQLQSGKVLGAALDVLEYEEQAFNVLELSTLPAPFQYLRQAPNVILTPHTAGLSHEVMEAHAKVLVAKIEELPI
ncbi:MAG: NAD(P)-dependent oxidoreductase [Phaeodactylibacter xiamenensis]|uniref:2-hydroxyacid dehydrogenase n=1 Tax=Phaeodactylibacter xiamenensis TaxID=1524460 RepID=A0A098S4I3_9BACT|nr:NAD(P)-dependent oxidoreductase [Phaeodactylibacter xiamenensis]KGE86921.1 2-hydroxyacid dehydrogenase [Phaeodactylibacter xiamenensis]MCR9053650.1 hydroxyacid dehydrogenase [bacterium]